MLNDFIVLRCQINIFERFIIFSGYYETMNFGINIALCNQIVQFIGKLSFHFTRGLYATNFKECTHNENCIIVIVHAEVGGRIC